MTTLLEARNEILRLARQTVNGDLVDDATNAINDAIAWYAPRAFEFNEATSTIPTVDGVAAYDFPGDLGVITHAQLFWGGSNYTTLHKRNWQWLLDINQDASSLRATPSSYYSVFARQIHLYPTPSASVASLELYYLLKIDPLVNDDDTNVFLQNARLLIRSRALYDLYANRLQNIDLASTAREFEKWELERLTLITGENLGAETIQPFRF